MFLCITYSKPIYSCLKGQRGAYMKRIIIHWTAGKNQPNSTDYQHYHYMVTGDGLVVKGKHSVLDNENCTDGNYAAHTGGGNTGSIGVALCGMMGFKNSKSVGNYPLIRKQCERAWKLVAELSRKYGIPITANNVMTHYEFGLKHPKTTSRGKIDIIYLPPFPYVKANEVGDFIRNKARWYRAQMH